jgi:phage baseplate assembly protein W
MATDFIGQGIGFPMRTSATGGVALVTREREVEEAIRLVLGTAPGERPMRPEFGSRISEHVFGPANASTAGQLAYEVRASLERWEPRIDVDDVEISFDAVDSGILYIDVRYRLRGTNDPRNLVFPFYLIGDNEPPALPAVEPFELTAGTPAALPASATGAVVVTTTAVREGGR